jgi:hypothetical protein
MQAASRASHKLYELPDAATLTLVHSTPIAGHGPAEHGFTSAWALVGAIAGPSQATSGERRIFPDRLATSAESTNFPVGHYVLLMLAHSPVGRRLAHAHDSCYVSV